MASNIDVGGDLVDVRDVVERVEGLESAIEAAEDEEKKAELRDDLAPLAALLDELKGHGGDEQWRGGWYPLTLIADGYFETYAEELAEDIGAIDSSMGWPLGCIDWAKAARELQADYSSIEYDGVTYWYR